MSAIDPRLLRHYNRELGYAAPEIFGKYKRSVGPWTDVYSLALTVLALAKGRPLDMGITIVDALEARDTVPDLSFLEPDLVRVFTGMLQPDPEVRFRSMEAVIEALDAPAAGMAGDQFGMTTGAPTMPPPASPAFVRADAPSIAPPAKAKSKAPLFGGIAAVVLLLGSAGGYFALSGGPKSTADIDATAAPPQTANAPDAGSRVPTPVAKADWSSARPQLLAALAAVPCSDLRVAGTPGEDGAIRVTGWRAGGTVLPTAPSGCLHIPSGAT
ncbi:hypothetical protein [Glacieibacterium sp.]|uniref:hypothetical protein n=1 Tax=Glacieibacterium sp. TaxID=2860237 RepID=UPI003AFF7105